MDGMNVYHTVVGNNVTTTGVAPNETVMDTTTLALRSFVRAVARTAFISSK